MELIYIPSRVKLDMIQVAATAGWFSRFLSTPFRSIEIQIRYME